MLNGYDYSKILCNTPPETIVLPLLDIQRVSNSDTQSSINMCDAQQIFLNDMINACCSNCEYFAKPEPTVFNRGDVDEEEVLDDGPVGLTIINCEEEDGSDRFSSILQIVLYGIIGIWVLILKYGGIS